MKKMRRLLAVLFAAVLLASAVPTGAIAAEEYYTDGYYTYSVENGEAAVISVDTAVSGAVTVPDTLGGCPVTLIGSNAFAQCSAVTDVILPDSVTEIGDSAFYLCYCLRRVVMGSNVSVLGNGAFSECRELSEIALSEENPYFTVVDGVLFNEDMTALIRYPSALWEDKYVVPESVTRIEANAFQSCYHLLEIVIPDSVTEIGDFAFAGCTKIRDIVLPPYITEIRDYAFSSCYNLENVSIPEGVSAIGMYAFAYNEKLTLVSIPSSVEFITGYAFYGSNAVADVYYGGTEEQWAELYIGEYNDSLLSSELHYGLCEHKMSKFILEAIPSSSACAAVSRCSECGYHISRYVPDTSIEDAGAYYDGTYIFRAENGEATIIAAVAEFSGDVVIPRELDGNTVTSIEGFVFYGRNNIRSITLPETLESFDAVAFSGLDAERILIPASVREIRLRDTDNISINGFRVHEDNPYYSSDEYNVLFNKDKTELIMGNMNLIDYTVPATVKRIGVASFCGTARLERIVLPEGLESIGRNAFLLSHSLREIVIPDSVTSVGESAFDQCQFLEKITVLSRDAEIGENIYYYAEGPIPFPADKELYEELYYHYGRMMDAFYRGHEEEYMLHMEKADAILSGEYEVGEYMAVIYCYEGSTADIYAQERELPVVYLCDHDKTVLPAVPPTCTETGLTEGLACSKCGEVYTAQETVPVIDHSHTPSVTTPATHLSEGVMTYTCVCGDSFTETIARLEEHTYTAAVTAPTCTEKGYTTYTCACGDSFTADYTEPSGHAMGEWTVNGSVRTRSCAVCGMKETVAETDDGNVEIEAPDNPGHDFEVDEVIKGGDKFILVEEAVKGASGVDAEVLKAFDINLKNHDGVHVQPDGTVKVKLPLDWSKNGNYKVYRVNDDGSLTDMNAFRQGSHMVFETDHFSIYVIVEETPAEEEPSTEEEKPQSGKKDVFLFLTRLVRALERFFMSILEILGF